MSAPAGHSVQYAEKPNGLNVSRSVECACGQVFVTVEEPRGSRAAWYDLWCQAREAAMAHWLEVNPEQEQEVNAS